MKKRKIIALVSIAILLIVVASTTIVVYALDETIDLKSELAVEDENRFTVRFSDGENGNDLAHVNFNISGEYNGLNNMKIQIWHEENTHLDKLTLTFPNIPSSRIMFALPDGGWPPMGFDHTNVGKGVIVDIPEFGSLGRGTQSMEFNIIRYYGDAPEKLYCYIDMHLSKDEGLKDIEYNAYTYFEVNIPE